jgi:1,4-dihydroxy-2-naphthoyl-CoA hydrolase
VSLLELEDTLDGVLGFELLELSGEHVRAQLRVHDRVRQRFGIVHGGAYCAIAEVLASEATVCGVAVDGNTRWACRTRRASSAPCARE